MTTARGVARRVLPREERPWDMLTARREEIIAIVTRHHGRSIAVFGSVARGDDHPGSDIDFLVDFEAGSSLFDLLYITDELTELLGRQVDVVGRGGLKDRDDHIRREAIPRDARR